MSTKTNKLKTKDLIIAGAFAALYVVVLFAVVTVMGFVPILYLIAPFVNSVILGCIYMMYVTKVPKTGAILILSVAVGLLTSTGGVWVSLIWCLTLGIVAELIARAGNHMLHCGLFRTFQENSRLKDPSFTTPCTKEKVISLHTLC